MPERIVPHFQEELEQLKTRLLEMGGLAEDRVRSAVKGLVERDAPLVDRVLAGDGPINQLHIEIDSRCFKLLALHQPMAVDLRAIVSAVKINTDLERVGDLAINIAEAVRRYMRHPPVKELIDIPRMADIAQRMLRNALDAYVRRDIELAQGVLNEDDTLDALKTQVFRELLTYMLQDPHTIEPSLDLILDLAPPRAHRRPRHQRRRGRHLHGVRPGRPAPCGRSRSVTGGASQSQGARQCVRARAPPSLEPAPLHSALSIDRMSRFGAARIPRACTAAAGRSTRRGGRSAASAARLADLGPLALGRLPGAGRARRRTGREDAGDDE